MKILFFIAILFCLRPSLTHAQGMKSILDNSTNPGEVLVEFDDRSSTVEGTYYINDDWQKGDIYLKSGHRIDGKWIKYDLEYDLLEIRTNDRIKVVPLNQLEKYIVDTGGSRSVFLNCDHYRFDDGTGFSGICKQLDSLYFGGLIKFDFKIKEPDYVPALDMGSRSREILIEKSIFLRKGQKIYELPGKRKDFINFFSDFPHDLKTFIKENRLQYRKETDLARILKYINSDRN